MKIIIFKEDINVLVLDKGLKCFQMYDKPITNVTFNLVSLKYQSYYEVTIKYISVTLLVKISRY